MGGNKFGKTFFDIVTSLTNNLEISYDGILNEFISKETHFIHV
jgi:hypothetical protein